MQLGSDVQIRDGLLAENTLLREKPRLGFGRTETTVHRASIRLNYLNGNRVSSTVVFKGRQVSLMAQQQNSAAGSGGNNPINLNIAGVSVTGSYSVGGIQPASVYGGGISIDVNTDCSVCAWGQVITRTGDGATGPRIDDESYGPFYGDKGRGAQAFGDTPANGVGQKGTFQGVAVLGVGSEKSKSFVPLGAMIYKYSVDGHGNTSMPITPRLATGGWPRSLTKMRVPPVPRLWGPVMLASQNNRMTSTNERGVTAQVLYDASGNVTWDGVNYYLYDAEGRICVSATRTPVFSFPMMKAS
jgi:hypothetical protein